jgi:aminoglycoside phosphotransferase (APT) family kinase protein
MSEKAYLLAVARTLRDIVAPLVESGHGQLALLSCERILLRLAHPQQSDEAKVPSLTLDELPPDLRQALAIVAPRPLAEHEIPCENSALEMSRAGALDEASSWIDRAQPFAKNRRAIAALVDWEGRLQDAAELNFERLEQPVDHKQDTASLLDPKAIETYFQSRCGTQVTLSSFKQLIGGSSKQTALISLSGAMDLPSELVIRRDQSAATMAGSVVQEYPMLQTLYDCGVAVPRPLFLETSPAPLGKSFIVMERVEGRSLTTHFSIPKDRELAFGLAEQLARLHSIPTHNFSGAFDAPPRDVPADQRRQQLQKMLESWQHFSRTPSITMSAAFRWLEDNIDCAEGPMTLVHGDLGFHNILFDGKRFVALLDWETAHIDNPAGDLGYVRPVIEQMVPWQEFIECYRGAGGQPVTDRQVHFFGIWEILRINIQLRHARMLYETGVTDDVKLGVVGAYYVPRFVHRISQHLRRALEINDSSH